MLQRFSSLGVAVRRLAGSNHQNASFRRSLSTTTSSLVTWTLDETSNVGTIVLESPETYNALTVEMGKDFTSTITEIREECSNKNINAIVVEGSGDKAFSAGGNFDWLRSLKENSVHANTDNMLSFYKSFLCIRTLPVPIIGALHGPAVGAGAGLALACDLRVGALKQPKLFGFTFSRLGIHTGMGVSHFLQHSLTPSGLVNEMLYCGKFLSGEEAIKYGLINRLVEQSDVKKETHMMAEEIARQHPLAIRTMVKTLRTDQDAGLEAALAKEAYAQALCYHREDWGEGLDAVVERREPKFGDYHDH